MNKIGSVLPLVLTLIIGVIVGRFMLPPLETKPLEEETSELSTKVQSLSALELAEYHKLKTLEEKYNKADEILGKIMAIFIADLGLHMNKPQLPSRTAVKPVQAVAPPAEPLKTSESTVTPQEKVTVGSIGGKDKAASSARVAAEKSLADVRTPSDVNDFLSKVKADNLAGIWGSTARFSNSGGNLENILGRFRGTAQVTTGGRAHAWGVMVMINGGMEDGVLKGRAAVTLSDETGRPFSNQRDGGNIRLLKEFTDGSSALFLRANPETYFQLYYAPGTGALIGNVYQGEEPSVLPIGTVELRK